jgi:hypothetical protein
MGVEASCCIAPPAKGTTMSFGLRMGRLSCLAGIVVMVLLTTATAAQAKGEWKVAEQTMDALEAPEASISGTASETFKLSVAWYASEIECSTLATEAPTKIFPGGTSEAILKLSSCQVLGPPFVAETCKVVEPLELKVLGELLPHGGKTYELFKAATGETLGLIKFKEGTECPIPLSNELKGTFVGETEAGERTEQPRTFNSTIAALFGSDLLSFGTHPATLKGKSTWSLAAGYKGLKWAAEGGETAKEEKEKLEKEALEVEEEEELEKEALAGPWTLLRNGASAPNNLLNLNVSLLEAELLVPELGLEIRCTGGNGAAHLLGGATLSASVDLLYSGCTILKFSACTVHSSGAAAKTILIKVKGLALRSGEETILLPQATEEEPFTNIVIEGELCPFTGIEKPEPAYGTVLLTLLKSSVSQMDHLVDIDDEELFVWYEEVEFGALIDGFGGSGTALAHVTEVTGSTWAIDR